MLHTLLTTLNMPCACYASAAQAADIVSRFVKPSPLRGRLSLTMKPARRLQIPLVTSRLHAAGAPPVGSSRVERRLGGGARAHHVQTGAGEAAKGLYKLAPEMTCERSGTVTMQACAHTSLDIICMC